MIRQFADRRIKSPSGQLPISIIANANPNPCVNNQPRRNIVCTKKYLNSILQNKISHLKTYSAIYQTAGNHTMSWDRKGKVGLARVNLEPHVYNLSSLELSYFD